MEKQKKETIQRGPGKIEQMHKTQEDAKKKAQEAKAKILERIKEIAEKIRSLKEQKSKNKKEGKGVVGLFDSQIKQLTAKERYLKSFVSQKN